MPSTVRCGTDEAKLGQNLLVLLPLVCIVPSLTAYASRIGCLEKNVVNDQSFNVWWIKRSSKREEEVSESLTS